MSKDTAAENVPRRVGRYEIVGPLASGGMAEILLGRLVGPSGFQRAVVIKRILRHLARKKDFVDMFLDEARIVASIRHPNVVQVHELGHEDEELFLVMEYLEGESAAGLMRRLHATSENLDFALCAYVVAEACSGLHAAHELTDASGKNLGVVHRDVSPHNVFVGYGGAIKVLDFGIAIASDESRRVAHTEAGQFKGKLEYASPEQCKGKSLDRRSDIFALGTILWELTTGMRLFKRPNALDMAKAICERPIPSPTSIVKDYPEELAAITMRALARSRKERYQTALELRRDLLAVMRKLSPSPTPDEDLAQVMRRLFADRIEAKTEMLRHVQVGSDVANVPAGEADEFVQLPVAQTDPEENTQTDSQVPEATMPMPAARATKVTSTAVMPRAVETTATGTGTTGGVATPGAFHPQPAPPSRVRNLIVAAAIVAAAIGVILIAVSLGARAVERPETVSAAPVVAPVEPLPASAEAPTPPASESAPAAPARPSGEATALVHVDTVPPKATVLVNGVKKGVSPLDLRLPRGSAPVTIEIRQAGYVTTKERVVPDANHKLRLTLVPETKPAASTNVPYHRFD